MITDVNESTLPSIQNPVLRSYAAQYVDIYNDFRRQVCEMGINFAETDSTQQVRERVNNLGRRGAIVRNDGKTVYVNRISPSCVACQTAAGSHRFFISLKCHRDCFSCFNPNQEGVGRAEERAGSARRSQEGRGRPQETVALTRRVRTKMARTSDAKGMSF